MNYRGDLGLNSLTEEQCQRLEFLRSSIAEHFNHQADLIERSDRAASHAADLLQYIDADIMLCLYASHLFEIGFETAYQRHGDLYERFIGQENLRIVEKLLDALDTDEDFSSGVCELVSSFYGQARVDTPELHITRDAMNLVKCASTETCDQEQLKAQLNLLFQTEPGYRRACRLFLRES